MEYGIRSILISALIFLRLPGLPEGAPQLFIDFNTSSVSIDSVYAPAKDSTFTAGFYISDISDLCGYQFYVQFDTTKLRYFSSSKATSSVVHMMETNGQTISFESRKSINRSDRILIGGTYLGMPAGAIGSGYLGIITFQRLTSDTTQILVVEPIFLNSSPSANEIAISSISRGLLLPPGSISVKQRKMQMTDFSIQISNRTVNCSFLFKSQVKIRLLDISGRSVFEKKNISQRISFNLPDAGSGVYMLSISNRNESIAHPVIFK